MRLRRSLAVVLALAASSCACPGGDNTMTPIDCGGITCLGCCNAQGLCESGMTHENCGRHGRACSACDDGSKCIAGVCAPPFDGGPFMCGSVTCDGITADLCVDRACTCGGNRQCGPGSVCLGGVCSCGPCDAGCCSFGACKVLSLTDCGPPGGACFGGCSASAADGCGPTGACQCGQSSACGPDLICSQGSCVTAETCPDGCLNGTTCVALADQTLSRCGAFGAMCVACPPALSDHCGQGLCLCGNGSGCAPGQACRDGGCDCDVGSCPNGCCEGNVCVDAALQSASECGPPGGACAPCPQGQACSSSGCH